MKKLITIIIIAITLGLAGGISASQAQASQHQCHSEMYLPGYDNSIAYLDVWVTPTPYSWPSRLRYAGMNCSRALRVAHAAWETPGLRTIFGPQFGAGGYGGPFHVGHLSCWLDTRGSDFKVGACWHGHGRKREYVRFYDHRDYWT